MTPTETIAKKLWGWKPDKRARGCKWTRWTRDPHDVAIIYDDGVNPDSDTWPDFADEIRQHYWIRRMEDRLAEMPDWTLYQETLKGICLDDAGYTDGIKDLADITRLLLRASASQRLAAAVRVCEGAGL